MEQLIMAFITYPIVAKACNDLQRTGITPSVRKVREALGSGSNSVIAEHLRTWREEQLLATTSTHDLSQELIQALQAECARVAQAVSASFREQLTMQGNDLEELRTVLHDTEHRLRTEESKHQEAVATLNKSLLDFEKHKAALESQVAFLKEREQELQRVCAAHYEKAHQAELRAAVAEAREEGHVRTISDLHKQLEGLQKK